MESVKKFFKRLWFIEKTIKYENYEPIPVYWERGDVDIELSYEVSYHATMWTDSGKVIGSMSHQEVTSNIKVDYAEGVYGLKLMEIKMPTIVKSIKVNGVNQLAAGGGILMDAFDYKEDCKILIPKWKEIWRIILS